jgi:hypothetical protein
VHHHGRKDDDAARDPDAAHGDHDPIVELEYFRWGVTAEIVAAKLKANDIPCFTQAATYGFNVAYGAFGQPSESVCVFQSDLARARALVEEEASA